MNTPLLPRAEIGIVGLDDVIGGGLARNRLHLLEGSPGTGKTTIALQFLMAGAKVGEVGIYVSLAETEQELRDGALSHGWVLAPPIAIFELVPPESVLDADQHQSLLYSSDLELGEAIQRILAAIERFKPKRVVIDSLSEIRLLAQSSLRYRRQILALKHYFARHQSTVQAAMPEEQFLILHLHEILQYLNRQGVATFLTVAQQGMIGDMKQSIDLTYLADNVVLLRFFEAAGRIRRAVSVVKKRTGSHENAIREFHVDRRGIAVGPSLERFQGVLRGVPTYIGPRSPLMEASD